MVGKQPRDESVQSTKLGVLILAPSLEAVSGIATHARLLLSSAITERFSLQTFQLGGEGLAETRLERVRRHCTAPFRFVALLRRMRPAVVHINTSLNRRAFTRDVLYLTLAFAFGVRTVVQFHGGWPPALGTRRRQLTTLFLRVILGMAHAVVVICDEDEEFYLEVVPDRVARINNGVDTSESDCDTVQRFHGPYLRLTFMGRLIKEKGVLDLIAAVSILKERGRGVSVRLTIAGDGPLADSAKATVRSVGLNGIVAFVGVVLNEDKRRLLHDTDLLVVPTYCRERSPYAILEAMAVGIPPVTCASGSIPNILSDGVEGVFAEPRNPAALAAAIEHLIENRATLDRLSSNARKRIREQRSLQQMSCSFADLYAAVLARNSSIRKSIS